MAIELDLTKITKDTAADYKKWQPPVPESTLKYESARLPVSTRVYPEFLVALYLYFEQTHGMQASSLSELVYWSCCETLNLAQVQNIPPPDLSASFLMELGFASMENKESQGPLSTLFNKAQELETQAYENGTLTQQAKYWKHRDPQKYEAIMAQLEQELSDSLSGI